MRIASRNAVRWMVLVASGFVTLSGGGAASIADEPAPQVVNKPVVDEKQAAQKEAAQGEQKGEPKDGEKVDADRPLHEHPTLLKMLARNNQLRQNRGLRPHRINPALTKAAQDHAAYMARTRVFSHYSNGGPGGRAVRHGFGAGVMENIGYGYGNVEHAFSGWYNSSGHWANMMSNTSDAGFGYAVSPDGTPYWVAVYGTAPKGQEPAAKPVETKNSEIQQAGATEPVKDAAPKSDDKQAGDKQADEKKADDK